MTKPQLGGAGQPGKMAGTAGQEPHGHLEHVAEAGGALGPSSPRAHRRASGGQLEGRGWCGEEHLLFKGRGQAKGLAPGRAGRGAGTGADGRAIRGVVMGRHGPPRRERGKSPAPTSSNLLRDQTEAIPLLGPQSHPAGGCGPGTRNARASSACCSVPPGQGSGPGAWWPCPPRLGAQEGPQSSQLPTQIPRLPTCPAAWLCPQPPPCCSRHPPAASSRPRFSPRYPQPVRADGRRPETRRAEGGSDRQRLQELPAAQQAGGSCGRARPEGWACCGAAVPRNSPGQRPKEPRLLPGRPPTERLPPPPPALPASSGLVSLAGSGARRFPGHLPPQQPEGSRLSPYGPDPVPEAPEEVWVPENAPAMQSCPQDKAPGPGGRGGRAAGHHWTPAEGTPGHRSGWAPMTRAPGPVLRLQQGQLCPGQAPTQDVTSACGCPLPAWALGGREPPRPAEPPSRQGPGLSRLGHPGWARPH